MRKKRKTYKRRLDELWSRAVRLRDKYTCQKCGRTHKQVQAAHIFSRNRKSVRWDIDNGITLCYYCHIHWAHREPLEFAEWIKERLGEEKYEKLKRRAYEIAYDIDPEEIEAELKILIEEYEKQGGGYNET